MSYRTPDNLVGLLDGVVRAASRTAFYSAALAGRTGVSSQAEFGNIPVTPVRRYREQRLADVVADPAGIEWIVGRYRGHAAPSVAVAEGEEEGANRYDLFTDALKECISLEGERTCAVVATHEKRYFGAEIATILVRSGIPSHLFMDTENGRIYEILRQTSPNILVVLSERLVEGQLPASVELCVTFRRPRQMTRLRRLDIHVVDELGFLGHSTGSGKYALNNDTYYFERSANGYLIATALYNKVQPMLRLRTMDKVKSLETDGVEFTELSDDG